MATEEQEQVSIHRVKEFVPSDYTDIAVLTKDDIQIVLRVADPTNEEQIARGVQTLLSGLYETGVISLDDLLGLKRQAQQVIDQMKKEEDKHA